MVLRLIKTTKYRKVRTRLSASNLTVRKYRLRQSRGHFLYSQAIVSKFPYWFRLLLSFTQHLLSSEQFHTHYPYGYTGRTPANIMPNVCTSDSLTTFVLIFVLIFVSCRVQFSMEESLPLLHKSSFKSRQDSGCNVPCRYVLAALSCSGFCVVYLLRVNLSVALVAMVNSTYPNEKASANTPECQRNSSTASSDKVRVLGVQLYV